MEGGFFLVYSAQDSQLVTNGILFSDYERLDEKSELLGSG